MVQIYLRHYNEKTLKHGFGEDPIMGTNLCLKVFRVQILEVQILK